MSPVRRCNLLCLFVLYSWVALVAIKFGSAAPLLAQDAGKSPAPLAHSAFPPIAIWSSFYPMWREGTVVALDTQLDDEENLHVAVVYSDGGYDSLQYKVFAADGTRSIEYLASAATEGYPPRNVDLVLDSHGTPHIAYTLGDWSGDARQIRYAQKVGDAWEINELNFPYDQLIDASQLYLKSLRLVLQQDEQPIMIVNGVGPRGVFDSHFVLTIAKVNGWQRAVDIFSIDGTEHWIDEFYTMAKNREGTPCLFYFITDGVQPTREVKTRCWEGTAWGAEKPLMAILARKFKVFNASDGSVHLIEGAQVNLPAYEQAVVHHFESDSGWTSEVVFGGPDQFEIDNLSSFDDDSLLLTFHVPGPTAGVQAPLYAAWQHASGSWTTEWVIAFGFDPNPHPETFVSGAVQSGKPVLLHSGLEYRDLWMTVRQPQDVTPGMWLPLVGQRPVDTNTGP